MSGYIIAEFGEPEALLRAARAARAAERIIVDGYSPFPVEGLAEVLVRRRSHVRLAMFICGFAVAAAAYALEWWTAVINYPIDSGGRPLHSWPAFMMFPFSVGILSASIGGAVALLWEAGLPRLHHPLFDLPGFDRASQDRFLLELEAPQTSSERERAIADLRQAGALWVHEVAK